jgi:transmembrane sensor
VTASPHPDERASREAHAWLARLQGDPSSRDRSEFERWCNEDPAHRQAYERVAADWRESYGLLAHTHVGRGRAGLAERSRRPRAFGLAVAAASLAILLAASLLMFRPGAESAARAEVITTAIGEIRTVTLPDASRLTLDTSSRVTVRYGDQERRVELHKGRARFAVRAADRPFVVEAEGGEIVGSGATFDVSLPPGGATVALIEGQVDVQGPLAAVGTAEQRTVRAGERVLVHPGGRLEVVVPASRAELRWPSGMLEFLNMPIGEAVAEANRYSSRTIRIADPAIAALRVTGTFRAGDTAGLARSLAAAFSLRAEASGEGDIILRPAG